MPYNNILITKTCFAAEFKAPPPRRYKNVEFLIVDFLIVEFLNCCADDAMLPLKSPFIFLLIFRKCIINTFSIDYHLWKASPRSTLSLARARRGRTYGIFAQFACVRPLRGRYVILLWNRRFRSLRSLHQRLWIFAAFGDARLR